MAETAVQADQLGLKLFLKDFTKCDLQVDPRGNRKVAARCNQLLQRLWSEMAGELMRDEPRSRRFPVPFLGFHISIFAARGKNGNGFTMTPQPINNLYRAGQCGRIVPKEGSSPRLLSLALEEASQNPQESAVRSR